MPPKPSLNIAAFSTDLGWMAIVGTDATLERVLFGHRTKASVLAAIDLSLRAETRQRNWRPALVERLQAFAEGVPVELGDVVLDLEHLTPFERQVVRHCRAIPYGQTRSYGDLARLSGSPRAARAVGHTMATNRFPLIVPCHRVITSAGRIGNYSAPGGSQTKRRLLALEQRGLGRSFLLAV